MPHIESALAVLKTIGLTQRQLAATIAWQATVGAIIGIAASVLLGTALGQVALDLVRPADLRGARTHRPGRDANRRNSRHPRAGQPDGSPAGPPPAPTASRYMRNKRLTTRAKTQIHKRMICAPISRSAIET
jgi:FtsX-like permease family